MFERWDNLWHQQLLRMEVLASITSQKVPVQYDSNNKNKDK